MRIIATIFLLFLGSNVFPQSEHYQKLFNDANSAFAENNFELALTNYQKILKTGLTSDELFYNIGNTYYKTGDYTSAILYYEKALKANASHTDAKFNLSVAKQNTLDKIEPLPTLFTKKILNSTKNTFSLYGWAISTIVLMFLASLFFIIFYISKSQIVKKTGFALSIVSILFFTASFVIGLSVKKDVLNNNSAIIFTPSLTVKSAPNLKSTKLFLIHEGTKISILETEKDWCKIAIEDGNIGWIPTNSFQII